MARHVLLRRTGPPDPAELDAISTLPGVTIVDQEISRAILVDASDQAVAILRSRFKDWIVAEEVEYPPTPSRKKLDRDERD